MRVWLGLTSLFEVIYYIGLAGAYRHGDMSVAYPLARALPVVLVALITAVLGLGKPLSLVGVAAVGTTGYTLVDNQALFDLRSAPNMGMNQIEVAFLSGDEKRHHRHCDGRVYAAILS